VATPQLTVKQFAATALNQAHPPGPVPFWVGLIAACLLICPYAKAQGPPTCLLPGSVGLPFLGNLDNCTNPPSTGVTCSLVSGSISFAPGISTLGGCTVSGTPTSAGIFTGDVVQVGSQQFQLVFNINQSTCLQLGTVGLPFSADLNTCTNPPSTGATCSLVEGNIPFAPGINTLGGCTVSGTPTTAGMFNGDVMQVGSQQFQLAFNIYPHSEKTQNFDLTWNTDSTGVDDNGLPLNPAWSYQVTHPGGKPNYLPSCSLILPEAFGTPSAPQIVYVPTFVPTLGTCTSQDITTDINTGFFSTLAEEFGGYCQQPGPPDGHVNWAIATYQGTILWRNWSTNSGGEDDDDNLILVTSDNVGQTFLFETDVVNTPGIGLEFKQGETLDNFRSPFWKSFFWAAPVGLDPFSSFPPPPPSLNGLEKSAMINGHTAMVTGLFGLDAAHGGYAELHPVFSLAILAPSDYSPDSGTVNEAWNFFIRNEGNEGACASLPHDWPSADGTYTIQLPRPDGATAALPQVISSTMWTEPNSGISFLGVEDGDGPWSYLKFKIPPGSQTGIDGSITLSYSLKNAEPHKPSGLIHALSAPPPSISREVVSVSPASSSAGNEEEAEFGFDWAKISGRISDPAVQKRFLSDVANAFSSNTTKHLPHTSALPVTNTVTIHHFKPGAASRGELTHDVPKPDTEKQAKLAALNGVFKKYSKELNLQGDVCQKGFVWREANLNDHVCVSPQTRAQTITDTKLQSDRIVPGSSETCKKGFVWREADATDHICVTLKTRDQVVSDNAAGPSRIVVR
jgi:hypothetical protein